MTGITIDHLISTTVFIAAIVLFTGLFTQTLQAAILYQQNKHIASKASDLLDNILLNPGYPYHWGTTNDTLSCFGLQQHGATGYAEDAFALMRLTTLLGEPVEYPIGSGKYYNNVSFGPTGFLFVPIADSIDYPTASRLLGINGTYGFELSIAPLVKVAISVYQNNPLKLRVDVTGPGFPLGGADLSYYFFRSVPGAKYPNLELSTGTAKADSAGVAYLNFTFDGTAETFTIVAYASLSGLTGSGHFTQQTFSKGAGVMPFVVNYEEGKVYLAHSWDVQDQGAPVPNFFYNATFMILKENFQFENWPIANSTGTVNYGGGGGKYLYGETVLPVGHQGFLLVTYLSGNEVGMSIMPWGVGTLSVPVLFGELSSSEVWTASDLRQVTVDLVAYHAKITCWSLQGYEIWKSPV